MILGHFDASGFTPCPDEVALVWALLASLPFVRTLLARWRARRLR